MELKFKTNINCGGCIAAVSPKLNQIEGLNWQVDTQNPEKILTTESSKNLEIEIIQAVKSAGFNIEKI